MYNHAPSDYKCPICLATSSVENEDTWIKQDDFIYRDELVAALINSKFAVTNRGHVIVVPIKHFENLYELPENYAHQIMKVANEVAIAMKEVRTCDGITILQNNEPASEQHAFHYHMHIVPRFENDGFIENRWKTYIADPEERKPYSAGLKEYFSKLDQKQP